MLRKTLYLTIGLLLSFLYLGSAVYSLPSAQGWQAWSNSDLELLSLLSKQRTYMTQSGIMVKEFSQGRLSQKDAAQKLNSLRDQAVANFTSGVKMEFSSDQNLKSCGVDLLRAQLKQIKAAANLMNKSDIERADMLKLQSNEESVYRSQNRYFRARLNSINLFLKNSRSFKWQEPTKLGTPKRTAPAPALLEYYQYQAKMLNWQIEELNCAEKLMVVLKELAQGKACRRSFALSQIKALGKECRRQEAPAIASELQEAYTQELNSFYRFAESVYLLCGDNSQDALSRLYRWSGKLQENSQKTDDVNAQLLKRILRSNTK
ncbi:MAG: hypothetical protein ACI376_07340 [Candidatus Bruticola sp.]